MRSIVCIVLVVGCRPTTPPTTPTNEVALPSIHGGDAELARGLELDFRGPMKATDREKARPRAYLIYKDACLHGDRSACLRATPQHWDDEDLVARIDTNCRGGDDLSCRYIAWLGNKELVLSEAELHRGCAAGVYGECDRLNDSPSVSERRFAAEASCTHGGDNRQCVFAAESYLQDEPRNRSRARYLLELACQSFDSATCQRLAMSYQKGELPEPVPGRAVELQRFVCQIKGTESCAATLPSEPP